MARAGGNIWPGIGLHCPQCGGGLLPYYVTEKGQPWCHWCCKPVGAAPTVVSVDDPISADPLRRVPPVNSELE